MGTLDTSIAGNSVLVDGRFCAGSISVIFLIVWAISANLGNLEFMWSQRNSGCQAVAERLGSLGRIRFDSVAVIADLVAIAVAAQRFATGLPNVKRSDAIKIASKELNPFLSRFSPVRKLLTTRQRILPGQGDSASQQQQFATFGKIGGAADYFESVT